MESRATKPPAPELSSMVMPESVPVFPSAPPSAEPLPPNPAQRADTSMPGTPLGSSAGGSTSGGSSSNTSMASRASRSSAAEGPSKRVRFAEQGPGAGTGLGRGPLGQQPGEGARTEQGRQPQPEQRQPEGEQRQPESEQREPEPKKPKVQGVCVLLDLR